MFPNRISKPINADYLYHREFKPLLKNAGLSGFNLGRTKIGGSLPQLALTLGFRLGVVVMPLAAGIVAELLVLAGLPGIGSG